MDTERGQQEVIHMDEYVDSSSKDRSLVQEELERRLKCRMDRNHLVQKNILPAVSTSPMISAQTQSLQRAKTVDTLQQKLKNRVQRSELTQRNILPDSKGVGPSVQAKQFQLMKQRKATDLNERLAHRPGILDLVEENILEPELLQAVKSFTESLALTTPSPNGQQQETKLSDSSSPAQSPGDPYSEATSPQKSPPMLFSPGMEYAPAPPPPPPLGKNTKLQLGGGKAPSPSQARKKQQKPKYRKLRYHEYVPPSKSNAKGGKTTPSKPPKIDTPYALLLQQQQLFLQLQVLQQQYPNGVLVQKLPELLKNMPASLSEKAHALLKPKLAGMENTRPTYTKTHEIPEDIKVSSPSGEGTLTVRLDELKVNNLKQACKELNLIVSGKKVDLIERLLDHTGGVLPASVLQDQTKEKRQLPLNHGSSIESQQSISSSISPQSPDPYPFHFSIKSTSTMDEQDSVSQLLPLTLQQQFNEYVEKSKVEYMSMNPSKPVAPRPDLQNIVINLPTSVGQLKQQEAAVHHSKSLPTSPHNLSPASSTGNLVQEFMEQSPSPAYHRQQQKSISPDSNSVTLLPPPSNRPPSHCTKPSGTYTPPLTRPDRSSLPNPPPYPNHRVQTLPLHMEHPFYHQGNANSMQRSISLSGPSNSNGPLLNHGLYHSLDLSHTATAGIIENGGQDHGDTLFEDGLDMDIDNEFLEFLKNEDPGLANYNVPPTYSQQRDMELLHTDAMLPNSELSLGGPVTTSNFLSTQQDMKPMAAMATNETDSSWLNIDSSLLGVSPNSYAHDFQSSLNSHEHLPIEDIGIKTTAATLNGFNSEMYSYLDAGGMHSSLFGNDSATLMDLKS